MKKFFGKKLLSLFLVIAMIAGSMPFSVFAISEANEYLETTDLYSYAYEQDEGTESDHSYYDEASERDESLFSSGKRFGSDLLIKDLLDEGLPSYLTPLGPRGQAILDGNFEDDAVLIVLNRAMSRDNRTFTTMDFSDIGVAYVEDLNRLSDQESEYAQALWEAERNMILAESGFSASSTESNQALVEARQTYLDIREEAQENTLLNFDEYRQIMLIRLDQNCGENVLNVIQQLQQRNYIYWAGPNYIAEDHSIVEYSSIDAFSTRIPNDPDLHLQWAVNRISLPQAWNITTGSRNVRVGIIGSRIDANHPELQGRVRADLGGVFYNDRNRPEAYTWGTQQAGIIGAMGDNGIGIAGIAWHTEFVPLRAVNADGAMPDSAAIAAINHARIMGIPIISRSFSITLGATPFFTAVSNYTGLFVNSAGNDNLNTDTSPRLPGLSNVLLVGASGQNDTRRQYSNFGATSVHVFAPSGVRTTFPNNSFGDYSGTSASAPHAAGVAALVLSINPGLSAQEVRDIIVNSVDPVPTLANLSISGGRLNAYNAVRLAQQPMRAITFNPQGGSWAAPGSGTGNLTRMMLQSATNYTTIMNTNNTSLLSPAQVAPTRAGFNFVGWFTAATGGTRVNHNTAVTPGTGAITLHARWTVAPPTRTINFNRQGGVWPGHASGSFNLTRTMLQTATNYGTIMNTNNIALLNPAQEAPSRAGYTFAGWFTAATGGTRVNHNTTVTPGAGEITLYAQWTVSNATRTINFNPQGGTWADPGSGTGILARTMLQSATNYAAVMNTNNTDLLNPAQPAPTRVGYIFAGWFSFSTGGTRRTHDTPTTPTIGSITWHAQWIPISATRTVTFNPQGGTWAAPGSGTGNLTRTMLQSATNYATVMNTNNTALLNPAQVAPTRTGFTFAGWFTAATGGTQVVSTTAVTQGAGAITLHARWTPSRVVAVMNYTVPLRSGPNATYTSLGNATQGTRIAVVGTSGIWSNIQVGDRIGWVQSHRHSQLIENAEPHIAVMNYTIPLRGGPNATYTSLGNATQGTRVTVFGTSVDGVWTHIQMGTRAGWVMSHRHSQLIENAEPHIAVMNYTIPLRGGPNATYASLGNATLGARVTVFGTSVDGVWTHIQMGTRAGWVMSHRHNRLVGVMNHTVPLRSGPNATYASLGDIVQGTRITAIGVSADGIWTQIQAGFRVGWTQNHRQSPVIPNEEGPYQSTMNHTVPLRSGPDGTYASLGDATVGTTVIVFGTSLDGIWLNIQAGDRVGWVRHDRVN